MKKEIIKLNDRPAAIESSMSTLSILSLRTFLKTSQGYSIFCLSLSFPKRSSPRPCYNNQARDVGFAKLRGELHSHSSNALIVIQGKSNTSPNLNHSSTFFIESHCGLAERGFFPFLLNLI